MFFCVGLGVQSKAISGVRDAGRFSFPFLPGGAIPLTSIVSVGTHDFRMEVLYQEGYGPEGAPNESKRRKPG